VNTVPAATLACPRCGHELSAEALQPQGGTCSGCEAYLEATVFPALFRAGESSICERVVSGEAACFFHAERIAAFSCARCGRFLCALCRISWAGENICTACVEALHKTDQGRALASSRFHFDSLALTIAVLPVLTWIFSLLTAPIALGFALFTWRRECSIVPRSKILFLAAILFSVLTIAGWVVFWAYAIRRTFHSAAGQIG
jgi:hypothetical protein